MARQFNGTSQAAQAALDLSAFNKLSLAWWMYWNDFTNDPDDMAFEFTNVANRAFYINPNGSTVSGFEVLLSGNTGSTIIGYSRPSATAWHHYVATFDMSVTSNGIRLYIDGTAATIISGPTGTVTTGTFLNDTLYFMSRFSSSLFGAGRVAEIGLWSVTLSAGNITSLAGTLGVANSAALPSSIPTGLIAYWPFLGTASPETDIGGGSHNATLIASPPQATHPIEPNYAAASTTLMGAACM